MYVLDQKKCNLNNDVEYFLKSHLNFHKKLKNKKVGSPKQISEITCRQCDFIIIVYSNVEWTVFAIYLDENERRRDTKQKLLKISSGTSPNFIDKS